MELNPEQRAFLLAYAAAVAKAQLDQRLAQQSQTKEEPEPVAHSTPNWMQKWKW